MAESDTPSVDGLMRLIEKHQQEPRSRRCDIIRAYAERLAASTAGLKLQAWMNQNTGSLWTASDKDAAIKLGYGHWPELVKQFSVPLYALPLSPGDLKSESEVQTAHATSPVPSEINKTALTFDAFRQANVTRCVKWHPEGIASWSPSDWLTAVTGELGELASLLKMRNRERDGLSGNKFSPTQKMIADELADVLTYLDLLAEVLGVNLGAAAVEKFNEVSERVGFSDRIVLGESAAARPSNEKAPVSAVAEALQVLRPQLAEVEAERVRQDGKWGGAEHDDHHTTADFVQLIQDYAGWARVMAGMNSPDKVRRRLIQVAAMAVAEVERLDRARSLVGALQGVKS